MPSPAASPLEAGLKMRAKATANGTKTAGELGLSLKCAYCDFVVEESAIVTTNLKGDGRSPVVGHPIRAGCLKASRQACAWTASSTNWVSN